MEKFKKIHTTCKLLINMKLDNLLIKVQFLDK